VETPVLRGGYKKPDEDAAAPDGADPIFFGVVTTRRSRPTSPPSMERPRLSWGGYKSLAMSVASSADGETPFVGWLQVLCPMGPSLWRRKDPDYRGVVTTPCRSYRRECCDPWFVGWLKVKAKVTAEIADGETPLRGVVRTI
jgi:hypothetical protein